MGDLGNIDGKSFIVTGGASGLGARYAEEFLKRGARAVAILDIAEETGQATAEKLQQAYPDSEVVFIKCDVSKESDIEEAFDAAVAQFKQIDAVINNAGLMNDSPNVWAKMCDVNFKGLVSFTTKAIQHMRKDQGGAGGTIVNVSSVLGLLKSRPLPVYAATKIAVLHFSQSVAMPPFFEQTGIRILAIGFGPTDTPLLHNLETLTYVSMKGEEFLEECEKENVEFQKVDSAVNGFFDMFTTGEPGTVWMSVDNKPAKDVTSEMNQSYEIMFKAAFYE